MDNKQDRQFLWNVKDFLTKSPNVQPQPKQNSLKDTIRNVTALAQPVAVPVNEIVNQSNSLQNQVTGLLDAHQNNIKRQKPNSIKSSNNISANIFNLTEAKDKDKKTDFTLNAFLNTSSDISRYKKSFNSDPFSSSPNYGSMFPWLSNYMGDATEVGDDTTYLMAHSKPPFTPPTGTYVPGGTGFGSLIIPTAGATAGTGKKVSPGSTPSSGSGKSPRRP